MKAPIQIEAILEDFPWIRGLSPYLLHAPEEVEDLAQDTVFGTGGLFDPSLKDLALVNDEVGGFLPRSSPCNTTPK